MSEPKLISPMLDNFIMGDPISEHDGVRCCPAMEKDTEGKYIVKIISTPASQTQLDALVLSGAYSDRSQALAYFQSLANDIVDEAQILEKLSKLEGFIAYERCQLVEADDETGYEVYLLNPYNATLERLLRKQPMTHLGALNLGLDICSALAVCRRYGYLYVDLKPENITITQDKGYRISDLGFMKLDSLKYASLPDRYRSRYTAPEIADALSCVNTTLDIYALGLILYQIFNDGQLPNSGDETSTPFAPPAYADYEMSEIILKACAPLPEERWQDPIEMGQALVGYMQRNGAHDTPIVPPVIEPEPETDNPAEEPQDIPSEEDDGKYPTQEDASPELDPAPSDTDSCAEDPVIAADSGDVAESVEEETDHTESAPEDADSTPDTEQVDILYTEDEQGVLSFLIADSDDETAPENETEEIAYDEVTEEVSDMLNQADDLISHETPDPVIPPEPIDVPIPEPLPIEEESDTADTDPQESAEPATDNDGSAESDAEAENFTEETAEEDDAEDQQPQQPQKKKSGHWIRNILLTLLGLALAAAAFFFYKNYYLQPVHAIVVDDSENGILTVIVTSDVPDEKLNVLCIDTYGNQLSSPVLNGKARFSGLAPDSAYRVEVDISGFHRLTGDTSTAFTTPVLTDIVQFHAVTGDEDGSVILGFTIDGPDPEQWKIVSCATDGTETEHVFSGHTLTLTGLSVGSEYTFTLQPVDEIRTTGTTQITHIANKIVKPTNVTITGCYQNKLGATWNAPADTTVESWTVRCYNDAGYDQTIVANTTEAAFDIPDDTAAYTVEVSAAGMSVSERAYAAENSVTVGVFETDVSDPNKLVLSWKSSIDTPEGGWIVLYSINGNPAQEITCESGTSVTIAPVIPGAQYAFSLQTVAGNSVLGGNYTYDAPDNGSFSGYGVTAANMEFMMCKRPSYEGWDRYSVARSDYRTELYSGENGAYVIRMNSEYDVSDDNIVALFVIEDATGTIVSTKTSSSTWKNMWYKNYCELDIPTLPQAPGSYHIRVYFNGGLATQHEFTIAN